MESNNEEFIVDQVFEPSERLYRFIKPDRILAGRINPNTWDLPPCSVDREKYLRGASETVTPSNSGYAETKVADLPKSMTSEDQGTWDLVPVHVPDSTNPAHSELRLHKDGVFSKNKKPGSLQKKEWKGLLSEAFVVVVEPPQS